MKQVLMQHLISYVKIRVIWDRKVGLTPKYCIMEFHFIKDMLTKEGKSKMRWSLYPPPSNQNVTGTMQPDGVLSWGGWQVQKLQYLVLINQLHSALINPVPSGSGTFGSSMPGARIFFLAPETIQQGQYLVPGSIVELQVWCPSSSKGSCSPESCENVLQMTRRECTVIGGINKPWLFADMVKPYKSSTGVTWGAAPPPALCCPEPQAGALQPLSHPKYGQAMGAAAPSHWGAQPSLNKMMMNDSIIKDLLSNSSRLFPSWMLSLKSTTCSHNTLKDRHTHWH